jgi:glycosyltransferase involved in cell wall biosynthesis
VTLVSVVIPTYERATLVGGAIETALAQTHDEIEVIVVDGGSTDGTLDVLDRYTDDERVTVLHDDPNGGIAGARNRGVAAASGAFVCPLDDDDRWYPTKVERQLAVFGQRGPRCGVVYSGGVARRNGRVVRTYSPWRSGRIYPEILADFGLNPYSSHMIRRACFERVGGYDTAFPHGEDWDFCIRVARAYEFAAVSDPLVERRLHDGNRSQSFGDTTDMDLVRRKYEEEIARYPDIERQFVTRWYRRRSRVHAERGEYAKGVSLSLRAAVRAPSMNAALLVASACLGRRGLGLVRRLRARADRALAAGDTIMGDADSPAKRRGDAT